MLFLVIYLAISGACVSCGTADVSARRIDVHKNTPAESLNNNARVVGRSFANRYQFPYQVSIRTRIITPSQYSHICGGTLIHPRVVLTAAHCRQRTGSYQIAIGMLDRAENSPDAQYVNVRSFITHADFPGGVAKYDIGLLILQNPVTLNRAVSVIALPTTVEECDAIEDRILSGWGLTRTLLPILRNSTRLRWASLPQLTEEDCQKSLENLNNNSSGPFDETMVCTGADKGRWRSACSGDSGGPLANGNKTTIIGIVSWGVFSCGMRGSPTVYTNVCSYLSWIQETIDANL